MIKKDFIQFITHTSSLRSIRDRSFFHRDHPHHLCIYKTSPTSLLPLSHALPPSRPLAPHNHTTPHQPRFNTKTSESRKMRHTPIQSNTINPHINLLVIEAAQAGYVAAFGRRVRVVPDYVWEDVSRVVRGGGGEVDVLIRGVGG